MPVVRQKRIVRAELQANPHVLYMFGDNDQRDGYGGQAAEMRDEENAAGVRTKWAPSNEASAFFSDHEFDRITVLIDADLESAREKLAEGGVVVIPLDGLGTGLSRLPQKAPRIAAFLEERLAELEDL